MSGQTLLRDGADAITAAWMQRVLQLGAAGSPQLQEVKVDDLGAATNAFGSLLRCRLVTRDRSLAVPPTVIVKLPTRSPLAMKFAKLLALHRREYDYYRHVAPLAPVRSPDLLYGCFDDRSHRFVLVLEDLRDMETTPQAVGVAADRARLAVREFAKLHARFWEAVDRPPVAASYDCLSARYGRIMQAAYLLCLPLVLDRFHDHFSADTKRLAEHLGIRIVAHFTRVAKGPRTFIHGDCRGENLFFSRASPADFALVDWQGCGLGSGLYDVAYFLGTSVSVDDRRRIERTALQEYHDALCRLGVQNFSFAECWRSYRQNMLSAVVPCILGCGGLEMADPRMLDLAKVGLHRILTAIEDLDAAQFLPPRESLLRPGSLFTTLSLCGYHAYKLVRRLSRKNRAGPGAAASCQ